MISQEEKTSDAKRHLFFLAISTRTRSAEPNMERGSARVRVCQKQEGKSTTRSGICFFLAISTRTRSAEPNMERGSARVRVCKKQEEKSATRSGICISKCEAALVSVNRGILFIKTNEETM